MQQPQNTEPARRATQRRTAGTIRFLDESLKDAYRSLDAGNVAEFVSAHRRAGVTPPRHLVVAWARKALWKGELDAGLAALALIGASPDREDLLACARAASDNREDEIAKRAATMAAAKH